MAALIEPNGTGDLPIDEIKLNDTHVQDVASCIAALSGTFPGKIAKVFGPLGASKVDLTIVCGLGHDLTISYEDYMANSTSKVAVIVWHTYVERKEERGTALHKKTLCLTGGVSHIRFVNRTHTVQQ